MGRSIPEDELHTDGTYAVAGTSCFTYIEDKILYARDCLASSVTESPMAPAIMNTSAIPRPIPTPNQPPISCTPAPVVMNGMKMNCAIGPMRNDVIGEADISTLCAKPNTRPCLSRGTTFCTIVCSVASM